MHSISFLNELQILILANDFCLFSIIYKTILSNKALTKNQRDIQLREHQPIFQFCESYLKADLICASFNTVRTTDMAII